MEKTLPQQEPALWALAGGLWKTAVWSQSRSSFGVNYSVVAVGADGHLAAADNPLSSIGGAPARALSAALCAGPEAEAASCGRLRSESAQQADDHRQHAKEDEGGQQEQAQWNHQLHRKRCCALFRLGQVISPPSRA